MTLHRPRMMVLPLHENCVEASLIRDNQGGSIVFIPKIKLNASDINIRFTLNRIEFPIRLFYAMTMNKARGKTFDNVGIYLRQPFFTHGQLQVAFSTSQAQRNIMVRVLMLNKDDIQGTRQCAAYTRNIVHNEVL